MERKLHLMRRKLHLENKINNKKNKGFTLIEVLAVVAIIAVISSIGIAIYLNTIKTSKEKATTLAINNIMDAAETYTKEYNSIRWLNTYEESVNQNELKITRQYVCITVNELINSGYFNKNFYENEIYNTAKITNNSYVKITRDIDSKSDIKINVLPEVKEYNSCDKSEGDLQINNPKRYTDTIEAEYKDKNATASTAGKYTVYIKEENSQKLYKQDITSPISQTVAISDLKNDTKHIVSFCVTLDNITKCSHKDIYTADFEDSRIDVSNYDKWSNSKEVTIKFNDTNIVPDEARYYFYSDVDAFIEEDDVYICSDNSLENCTTKVTKITSNGINNGNWYLVKDLDKDKQFSLSVQENLNNEGGYVKTKILDKTGNESNTIKKIVNKIDIIAPTCNNITKMSNTVSTGTAIDLNSASNYISGTWYSGYVKTSAECTDTGGSGCSKKTVTTVGQVTDVTDKEQDSRSVNKQGGVTITWKVYDEAGNSATCSPVKVNLDRTNPSCKVTGGSSIWVNKNVTITGTCSDTGGSGCVSNTVSVTKTSNTNESVSPGIVKDNAGNTTTCGTTSVKIDKDAPKCTVSGGSSSWTNSNVKVTGTCSDTGGSGCVSNTVSVTKTSNTNESVSPGIVKDNAGNTTTCETTSVKIDKDAPTCTISGGNTTWTNSNVTVTGTCSDTGGSGCVSNTVSVTKTSNTNESVSPGIVKDNAGNSTTCSTKTVKIDKSAPGVPTSTIRYGSSTGTIRTNSNSWTNKNLWWGNFSATDTGDSGINHYEYSSGCSGSKSGNLGSSYTYPLNNATSQNSSFCIRAVDNAGNIGSWSSAYYFKIDKVSPTCTVSGGSSSWTKNNVTVTGTCSDTGGSGCKGNVSVTKTTDTNTSVSPGSVSDNAGNSTTCGSKTVKIDKSAPTTPKYTAKYASSGSTYTSGTWTNKKVNTVISSTDSGSGVSYMQYSSDKTNWTKLDFSVSALTQSGTTWKGTEPWSLYNRNHTYYFRACDNVGNCSGSSSKFNVKYDITAPTCTSSKSNTYTTSGVTASFSCSDNSSGVVSCTSKKTGLKATKSYTIKDNAGNSGTCNVTVSGGTRYRFRTCSACDRCTSSSCKTWNTSSSTVYANGYWTLAACESALPSTTNTRKYFCRMYTTTGNMTTKYQIRYYSCSVHSASCVNCGCATWNSWTAYTQTSCSKTLKGQKGTLKDCSSAYVYW